MITSNWLIRSYKIQDDFLKSEQARLVTNNWSINYCIPYVLSIAIVTVKQHILLLSLDRCVVETCCNMVTASPFLMRSIFVGSWLQKTTVLKSGKSSATVVNNYIVRRVCPLNLVVIRPLGTVLSQRRRGLDDSVCWMSLVVWWPLQNGRQLSIVSCPLFVTKGEQLLCSSQGRATPMLTHSR